MTTENAKEKNVNLDGKMIQEGNFIIGEGEAGMQMYDDTMNLAVNKTLKSIYIGRTILATAGTIVASYFAVKFDNIYIAAIGGALATGVVQQGKQAVGACRKYAQVLEEAVSHGWAPKEHLKRIGSNYL